MMLYGPFIFSSTSNVSSSLLFFLSNFKFTALFYWKRWYTLISVNMLMVCISTHFNTLIQHPILHTRVNNHLSFNFFNMHKYIKYQLFFPDIVNDNWWLDNWNGRTILLIFVITIFRNVYFLILKSIINYNITS